MKLALIFLILAIVCVVNADKKDEKEKKKKERFEKFAAKHGKKYKDAAGKEKAMKNLDANCDAADVQNKLHDDGKSTHKASCDNEFSDETPEETIETRCKTVPPSPQGANTYSSEFGNQTILAAPLAVDWTSRCISPVANQGQCGSCWAFAAQAQHECKLKIQFPTSTVSYQSPQYLVDCARNGNYGCSGGWPTYAMNYIVANGSPTSAAYPYTAVQSTCRTAPPRIAAKLRIVNQWYLGGNEAQLREIVAAYGPVVIAIHATSTFSYYRSGLLNDLTCSRNCANLNHAVVVTGYGVENGRNFWMIRNSWGSGWGAAGYVKMVSGVNMCGVGCWAMLMR